MIDIATEHLIGISKAPAVLPGRPSLPTIWRWIGKGVGGRQLESVTVGGRRYTSHEAVARFVAAGTAAQPHAPAAPAIRTSAAREKAIKAAEKSLAKAGI